MGTLEFISSLVDALAWPAAIVLIVTVLRRPLGVLIPNLRRLRVKSFEAEFDRELKKAEDLISGASTPQLPPMEEVLRVTPRQLAFFTSHQRYLAQIAETSPRAAVIEAWVNFESGLRASLYLLDLADDEKRLPIGAVLDLMVTEGLLTPNELSAVTKLRALRNELAHDSEVWVDADEAGRYISVLAQVGEATSARTMKRMGIAP